MKKIILKILIVLIPIILFILIRPIRTESVMKSIAVNEFENIQMHDSFRKQLTGPVMIDKGKYLEFKWYKALEWGDTSAVYIDVFKKPTSLSWRDKFFFPRITMNYQWYYFVFPNGTSKFADVLPQQLKKVEMHSFKFIPHHRQKEVYDSINFTIKPERIFYFLQKGHFLVVEKNDTYTLVDFHEPIATIVHKHTNDTIYTMSAKVFVNDSSEVLIIPYNIPIEIRNKK